MNEETYSLKFVRAHPDLNRADVGICDGPGNAIYVKNSLTKMATFRAVIHEILHGFECEYEIKLTHQQVYQLEKAIADFLLMNF